MIVYGIDANALLRVRPTGVERYVLSLLHAMMRIPLGVDERVVLYGAGPQPEHLILPDGWSWKELRFFLPKGWTHIRLSAELLLHPPDVFFCPAHEIPFLHRKCKIVTTVHDVVFRQVPTAYAPQVLRRQEWAVKRMVKQAETILTVSEATKQALVEHYQVTPEHVFPTLLAATEPVTNPTPAEEVLRKHRLTAGQYVLFVGRIEAKKNPATLVRAFIELKRKYGQGHPLVLVMAGAIGYGGEEAMKLAKASSFASDIRFPGYVADTDLPELMRNALTFVFPSLGEGFGIPVLEAMQYGAPVIVSDIPPMHEVAGDAAFFVPPVDVASLTTTMERFMLEPKTVEEYRQKGLARVTAFSWEKTAEATWKALRTTARE